MCCTSLILDSSDPIFRYRLERIRSWHGRLTLAGAHIPHGTQSGVLCIAGSYTDEDTLAAFDRHKSKVEANKGLQCGQCLSMHAHACYAAACFTHQSAV